MPWSSKFKTKPASENWQKQNLLVGGQVYTRDPHVVTSPYEAWRYVEGVMVGVDRLLGPPTVGQRSAQSIPQPRILKKNVCYTTPAGYATRLTSGLSRSSYTTMWHSVSNQSLAIGNNGPVVWCGAPTWNNRRPCRTPPTGWRGRRGRTGCHSRGWRAAVAPPLWTGLAAVCTGLC